MRTSGIVTSFDPKKGWGFISISDGPNSGSQAFAHQNDINMSGFRHLMVDEEVDFEITEGPNGLKATDINLISERIDDGRRRPDRRSGRPDRRPDRRPSDISKKINNIESIVNRLIEVLGSDDGDGDVILTRNEVDYIKGINETVIS